MGFGGFLKVLGGAMEGGGDALLKQAQAERDAAIKWTEDQHQESLREGGLGVEHGFRTQENQQQDDAAMGRTQFSENASTARDAANNTAAMDRTKVQQSGDTGRESMRESNENKQVGGYQSDDNNEVVGFDKTGKVVKTGISTGGLKKTDKAIVDEIKPQFTKRINTLDDDGNKTGYYDQVDNAGLAQRLTQMGRADLAKMYGSSGGQPQTPAAPGGNGGAMPVPQAYAGKPDGTVLSKGGKNYVKQGSQLIPQ